METFKIGDVVGRKSYGCDVIFKIVNIEKDVVDLVGLTVRIVADAPIYDLKHMEKQEVDNIIGSIEKSRRLRMNRCYTNMNKKYNSQNKIQIRDDFNIFKKDEVLKRPRSDITY